MTDKQKFTWKYDDFSIGFSDKFSAFTASLFKDEIALRTGNAQGFTDDCADIQKHTFMLEICPDFDNKDTFEICYDDGTYTIRARSVRGLIYGYSLFLRKATFKNGVIELTADICGYHSPRKALRGHQAGYRTTPNTYDAWDYDQYFRFYLDIMAFGANICEHNGTKPGNNFRNAIMKYEQYEFLQEATRLADTVDLDVSLWHANNDDETETEALALREWLYSTLKRLDYLFIPGGDPGEMPADKFIERCLKIHKVLMKSHPEARLQPSAQAPHSMPEWGRVFMDSIKDTPKEIDAIIMGPNHAFPIHELRAKTPSGYPLRFYPDITHNLRCEYPVNFLHDDWHFALASTLSRESVNPRPAELRKLHRIFSPYTIGGVSYSEGVHDDVNKAVWSALEWNPEADLREILLDYARLYMYGTDEEKIADTIFLLEKNWQGDPVENPCIDFAYANLCQLKKEHPSLATNWRFMLLYFRGCCDKLVKMRRLFENRLVKKAEYLIEKSCPADAIEVLRTPYDNEIKSLRLELDSLAEQLFTLIGIQLDVEHYCADSWERGATLETIDNNVTDCAFLLHKLQQMDMSNSNSVELAKSLISRNRVNDDEVYYSVALHGLDTLGVSQVGEFYMDIQGDRPYTREAPLPMSMTNVFDHFTFDAKFGGLNADCDYTLTIIYKGKPNNDTDQHKITINDNVIYCGPQYGGTVDPDFDEKMLAPGFQSASYLIRKEFLINGTAILRISEPTEGFKFCELYIKKNKSE